MEVLNPSNKRILGYITDSIKEEAIVRIEKNARNAQQCWYYEVSEQEKETVFRAIIAKFEKHRGELARTMIIEGGKLWRWADAEVQETIDTLWHYHGEISRCYTHDGFTRCQMPDKNAFSIRKPYGVILAVKPWNFPLAVPMWSICGALAGGNATVLKAAEQTPFTAQIAVKLIVEAIKEVISDERQSRLFGLVKPVYGMGETSGKLLVERLNYDKLSFTGSAEVGNLVASVAAGRGKPAYKEAGGHAAIVVLDDFDIDLAVAEAINANLGDSGQRCVSARVVFVQESRYEEFLLKYLERARSRRIGNPMDFQTEMGPLISKEQLERVDKMVEETTRQSCKPKIGGYRLDKYNLARAKMERLNFDEDAIMAGGYYYPPTVFTEASYGVCAMDKEIFGPVLVINPLAGKNREEAFYNSVSLVNKSEYGLSNSLLTNDRRLSSRSPWLFDSGIFYIGRGTTGAELNKYFGGIKASGWGREGRGLDEWTRITQVYDDYYGKARMAQAGADEKIKKLISETRSHLEQ